MVLWPKSALKEQIFGLVMKNHRFNVSPDGTSNSSVRIILETKNVDELFANALLFGATTICPMTTEDSWRIGKLKDPFGHIWELGYELD